MTSSSIERTKCITIDQDRLWQSHMDMAEIGALPAGGSCRLALSEDDRLGRDLFVKWCRDAGCDIRIDAIGNIFARRPGSGGAIPAVATGSHLDTQPHGGRFDGIYGVLAGLEVIRTLNDHNVETHHPVEVIVWTNEEGARFTPPLTGSLVFSNQKPLSDVHQISTKDGTTVAEDLENIGYLGDDVTAKDHKFHCFIEAHIEQGPILENANETIGVVTDIQGARAMEVTVKGMDNHAGTTPLRFRKDALLGAARMIDKVNQVAGQVGEEIRATVGVMNVLPNSTSSIAGEAVFHIDLRHPDLVVLDATKRQIKDALEEIANNMGLELEINTFLSVNPTKFNQTMVDTIEAQTQRFDFPYRRMISGAGHDAMNIAKVAPSAMIFIPCKDGVSHNEAEFASPEHLAAGANVLLNSIVQLSSAQSI